MRTDAECYVGDKELDLLRRSIALLRALRPNEPNVLESLTLPPSSQLPLGWDAPAVRLFAKKCKPLNEKNGRGYINDGAVRSIEAVFTGCRLLWIMADVRNGMPNHGQVREMSDYYSGISFAIKVAEQQRFPPCAFSTVGTLLRDKEVPAVLRSLFELTPATPVHHTHVDDKLRVMTATAILVFDIMEVEFLRQGVFDGEDSILRGDKLPDGMMIMDAALYDRFQRTVRNVAQAGRNTLMKDTRTLVNATKQWSTTTVRPCLRRVDTFMEMCASDDRPIVTILYEKMVMAMTPNPHEAIEAIAVQHEERQTEEPENKHNDGKGDDRPDQDREEDTKNNKMYSFHDPAALVSMWTSSSDSELSATTGARTGLCFMRCLRFVAQEVVRSLTRSCVAQAKTAGLSAQYSDMFADMARHAEDVLVGGNVDRIDDVGNTDMWQAATSARFWTSCNVNIHKNVMDGVRQASSPRHYSLMQYVRSREKDNDKLAAFNKSTTALRMVARQPLRHILLRRVIRHVEDGLDFGAGGLFSTAGVDAAAFMKRLAQEVFGEEDDQTIMTINQEMVAAIICVQVWTSRIMHDARARDNLACYVKNADAIETRLREIAALTVCD